LSGSWERIDPRPVQRASEKNRMIRRPYLAMFLILPAGTVVFFAMLIPLAYGLVMSLFDYKLGSESKVLDSIFGGLEKPGWALFSIAIADVWETTPFVLIVASAGLANIPKELYEAARIDGANALYALSRITLPLLSKVLLVVIVIRGTDAFRVFDIIYALTNGGPGNSTLSLSIYAFQKGFDQYEMGYAMTISIITMAALVVVFVPLMKKSYARSQ
jgi:ABC-type sugar transport system permease subunit